MRARLALAVLLSAALPASSGEAPRPKAGLAPLDASLERAAKTAKEFEAFLLKTQAALKTAPAVAAPDYREQYLKKLTETCRASFKPADLAIIRDGQRIRQARYLACSALAERRPSACTASPAFAAKAPLDGGDSAATNCLDTYYLFQFVDARVAGKDPAAVCRQAHVARGGKADVSRQCAALVAKGDCSDYDGVMWMPFEDVAHCVALNKAVDAGVESCPKAKRYDVMEFGHTCADVGSLAAARRGGSCGESALCRAAVTGKADACAPLYAALRDDHCAAQVGERMVRDEAKIMAETRALLAKQAAPRAEAMAALTKKRDAVDAELVALGAALESYEPRTDPGLAARLGRYREIRGRVDEALKRFSTAVAPAPEPAPAAAP